MKNKLLTPIIFNDRILKEIQYNEYILSRFPKSNFVKLWIINKLQEDLIIINASLPYENKDLSSLIINKPANKFINDKVFNNLYTGCYLIKLNDYYYIGSSLNLKERINWHHNNITKYLNGKPNNLSATFCQYISTVNRLESKYYIIYLNHNYLNTFILDYPDYKLNKAEFILLNKITDFIIKILELSLILEFSPKLNTHKVVVFKHFQWKDDYFNIYSDKLFDYLKVPQYEIFVLNREYRMIDDLLNYFNINNQDKRLVYYNKSSNHNLVRKSTLQYLNEKYNLDVDEVLNNLDKFHYYKGSMLINPLKIIEVN